MQPQHQEGIAAVLIFCLIMISLKMYSSAAVPEMNHRVFLGNKQFLFIETGMSQNSLPISFRILVHQPGIC